MHVLREGVGARRVAAQRADRELVGARRAAEPEVDAARVERLQRPELLGDHERRVVREHDPARADADRRRAAATCAITTAVAALAIPTALWCSASQ